MLLASGGGETRPPCNKYMPNLLCKSCKKYKLKIEKWDNNLYLGTCTNPNDSVSFWLAIKYIPQLNAWKWKEVSVQKPREKIRMSSYDKQQYDKLQIPFWKIMGQKAKPQEIVYEKELNRRGMTYGDVNLIRNQEAQNPSALPRWKKEYEKN